jgi:hypothetical protein
VLELLRLIHRFVALPREAELQVRQAVAVATMAYVTSWELISREEGLAQGLAEGKAEGQRHILRRMVQRRFGAVPDALEQRISAADQEALDALADRLLSAMAVEDLLADG